MAETKGDFKKGEADGAMATLARGHCRGAPWRDEAEILNKR